MPYEVRVVPDAHLVHGRAWGTVPVDEAIQASLDIVRDPGFQPHFGIVVDLLEMENVPRADEVMDISGHMTRLRDCFRHRIALITRGPTTIAAEVAAALICNAGVELQVFECRDAALGWVSERAAPPDAAPCEVPQRR